MTKTRKLKPFRDRRPRKTPAGQPPQAAGSPKPSPPWPHPSWNRNSKASQLAPPATATVDAAQNRSVRTTSGRSRATGQSRSSAATAVTTAANPNATLLSAQSAISQGRILEGALLTYQAADHAVHIAARRLNYPSDDEADITRFLHMLDGISPQPAPDTDHAAIASRILRNSHIPPTYSASFAVAQGFRRIASSDVGDQAEAVAEGRYNLMLMPVIEFVQDVATAIIPGKYPLATVRPATPPTSQPSLDSQPTA